MRKIQALALAATLLALGAAPFFSCGDGSSPNPSPTPTGSPSPTPTPLQNLSFAPAVSFGVSNRDFQTNTKILSVGDYNGDGKADIAALHGGINPSKVSLLLGQGNGNFTLLQDQVAGCCDVGRNANALAAADFDRDGVMDLAVVNETQGGNASTVVTLKWDGTKLVGTSTEFNLANIDLKGITIIPDPAGSDHPSIVVDAENQIAILDFVDFGIGIFDLLNEPAIDVPQHMASGDLNGDGRPDLAFVVNDGTDDEFFFWMANANGTFSAAGQKGSVDIGAEMDMRGIGIVDLNKDGKADVVLGAANKNKIIVLLSQGNGTFSPPQSFPTAAGSSDASGIAFADFNLDGNMDIVVANFFDTAFTDQQGSVTLFRGNGDGTFKAPINFPAGKFQGGMLGNEPRDVAVGDFNGDGKPDIALANGNDASGADRSVSILINTSN